ncbi:MAG TPA: YidC/Oxa1 family membrane protein insertase, partial [Phycisphaerae bacterium]
LQQETMKVYAEAGVNPAAQMLNMLPMLLQTPIWIALYSSLNVNIAMRHEGFILWIRDLTGPDALVTFAQPQNVPILSWLIGPLHSLNVLPILLSIAFVVQQKLMPKAPKPQGEPTPAQLQQEQMQKMMPFMSVMFGLFLYNAPSGLTLYIMSSTIFGTLEQWFIRRHIKRDEERGRFEFKPPDKPKRPRKPSFFEKLQQAAEEAQRQKSRRER